MEEWIQSIENAAKLASKKNLVRFVRFLDPAQIEMAKQVARDYGIAFSAFGGYKQAERAVGCFLPYDREISETDFPLVCLHSDYSSRFCSVTHRDLLGSFMALGLTRACIGDIIIEEPHIYLFADAKTAEYIVVSMTGAGRVPLHFEMLSSIPAMPEPRGESFSGVVSSLRLDAVLAVAYRLSRNDAQEYIRAGMVKVDHLICERVDMQLKENALLSVRGKGRIRLQSVIGLTKKQRIGISFFRYV